MSYHELADSDEGFIKSGLSVEGVRAWRRHLEFDHGGDAYMIVWKSDPATYVTAETAPYSESMVVLSGSGRFAAGSAPLVDIGPGSIVNMTHSEGARLEIHEPTRMVCVIVPQQTKDKFDENRVAHMAAIADPDA